MKFEVGKTYQKNTGRRTKCLAICESSIHGPCVLMEDSDFKLWTFHLQDYERGDVVGMREYKKPVTHERFVFWWKHVTDGKVWTTVMFERGKYIPGKVYDGDTLMKVDTVSYTEIP
jgi:hypothetical protein